MTIVRIEWPIKNVKYKPRIVISPRYAAILAAVERQPLRLLSGGEAVVDVDDGGSRIALS